MNFISIHTIQPYGKKMIIATPKNEKQLYELNNKWNILYESPQLASFHKIEYNGWNSFLLFFNLTHAQTLTYGIIAHEALHALDALFIEIGHQYDEENNEIGAYLIEWITNTVIKHFIDKKIINLLSYESKIKSL
jgi:hypothetical protein